MRQLNQNALDILTFLHQQAAANRLTPTRQEIADATGIKSKNTVQRLLRRLDAAGYIKLQPGAARAIMVLPANGQHANQS